MKKLLSILIISTLVLSACGTDNTTTTSTQTDVSPDRPSNTVDLDTPQ